MEIEHDIRKLKLEEAHDQISEIVCLAAAQLDRLFGPAMNTVTKGDAASEAFEKLNQIRHDQFHSPRHLIQKSMIGHMMLIDRVCDWVTPMLMQVCEY